MLLKKDAIIPKVRVSQKTKELAEQRAQELGLSTSEYVRYLIQKDIDKNNKK